MTEPQTIDSCRICGNSDLVPILNLGVQHLTGVFPRSRDAAITCGPLELWKCETESGGCGLLQLKHSYNSSEMYGENYGYRSSLNASMVAHLKGVVQDLSRLVELVDGDLVLDIGSNDGTTLSFYPETTVRVGVDPTAAKFRRYYKPSIQIVPEFFSAKRFDTLFGGAKARIVTSIAMLYDLEDPLAFAREVASILRTDGVWHFEQSYMPFMVSKTGYDTICHEHVEYYALSQIEWIMARAGLRILRVTLNEVNGGSFGVTVCKTRSPLMSDTDHVTRILRHESDHGFNSVAPFAEFGRRVEAHRAELVDFLQRLRSQQATVLGYGASTKGNVILQYCDIGPDLIPAIAEVNQEKFGSFTPGTWIPIVSEWEAHAMKPDYFLTMPWHFRDNLLQREHAFLESGGKMIFPLPHLEVVAG